MKRAWEDVMVDAAQYRAIAAEHHRLAGMCRSPESREQHLRLEQEFLALADGKNACRERPHRGTRAIRSSPDRLASADDRAPPALLPATANLETPQGGSDSRVGRQG